MMSNFKYDYFDDSDLYDHFPVTAYYFDNEGEVQEEQIGEVTFRKDLIQNNVLMVFEINGIVYINVD